MKMKMNDKKTISEIQALLPNEAKETLHEIQGLFNRRREGNMTRNVAMAKIEKLVGDTLHVYFLENLDR